MKIIIENIEFNPNRYRIYFSIKGYLYTCYVCDLSGPYPTQNQPVHLETDAAGYNVERLFINALNVDESMYLTTIRDWIKL